MASTGIVKSVYVFEQFLSGLFPCLEGDFPDHFRLQGLEENFHSGVVVAVSLAGHGLFELMLSEHSSELVRAVLRAAVRMEDHAFGRLAKGDGFVQSLDDQVLFHSSTGRPTDDAAGIEIDHDRQVQPTLTVERTAFELGLNTGQRGQDLIAMARFHIKQDGSISVAQEKRYSLIAEPEDRA